MPHSIRYTGPTLVQRRMATIKEPEKWFPNLRAVYSTGRSGAGSLELLKTTGLAKKVAKQRTPPVWRLAKVLWAARSDLRTASLATKTTGHAWMDALAISRRAGVQKLGPADMGCSRGSR